MYSKGILAICFFLCIALAQSQIIGYKYHVTNHATAAKDLIVNIRIFNVGESTAYDVEVDDVWSEDFERVFGSTDAHFDKLAAGANASVTFVVRPKITGIFESGAAKIQWKSSQKGPQENGYSNAVGYFIVESSADFAKRSAPNLKEWSIFAVLSSVCVGPALYIWTKIVSEYEQGIKKDNKKRN